MVSKLGTLLVLYGLLSLDPESISERVVAEEMGFDTVMEADYVWTVNGMEVEY